MKPLIASVSPSGHRISTPQPNPGFFRATKVGRCSDIPRICAYGSPVQGSHPATITHAGPGFAGCHVPADRRQSAQGAGADSSRRHLEWTFKGTCALRPSRPGRRRTRSVGSCPVDLSVSIGVSNERSSAAPFRRHRHDSSPQCSDARIGAGSRPGQESATISPKSAAEVPWKKARVLE